jgi:anthranilate synthase component I
MIPDLKQYEQLAKDYNLIPVYGETLADSETPVSVLGRFAGCRNVFLLESMEGGETWGRYSFIGVDPELFLEADHSAGRTGSLARLRSVYNGVKVAPVADLPRFCGGVVGFIGYEGICEFERMPAPRLSGTGVRPCSRFLKADCIVVFDNVRHTVKVVVSSRPHDFPTPAEAYRKAAERIRAVESILRQPAATRAADVVGHGEFTANMSKDEFCRSVSVAKKYIFAGDVIQVVLSQKFTAKTTVHAFDVYRALRLLNPSPYTFFLKIGDQILVGSSPEVMVRLTGSRVELRPIAGTRPRGASEQEDRRLADELLSDEKEKAEHVMLVDLGRNDVGRIAEPGSVQVREYMVIERYSHVMHLVSHVEGLLRKEFDAYDVIKAAFPAGTLSGAPKIRAMEIIRELEPEPRGIYGGAVGYISYDGNMDLAITIRTLEVRDGMIAVQAGAGIVFDSNPEKEFEETQHKARGMQKAVRIAENGLKLDQEEDLDRMKG